MTRADLIETMARAICGEAGYDKPWDAFNASERDMFVDCARAALAAIEAAGYRVVPVEPTEEMICAGISAIQNHTMRMEVIVAYNVMLAAAPKHGGPR